MNHEKSDSPVAGHFPASLSSGPQPHQATVGFNAVAICRDPEALKSSLFSRRRFHAAGNRPNDTLEKWQRRERLQWTIVWITAIISTPILIGWFWYLHQNYGPHETLPFLLVLLMTPLMVASICSCAFVLTFSFMRPRESPGRWIIVDKGIIDRYGKSPHRLTPFSAIHCLRIQKPYSGFARIIFETDSDTIHIAERSMDTCAGDTKDFLPFLNMLIERMKQCLPENVAMNDLVDLRTIVRRRTVSVHCCQNYDFLMMGAYFAPLVFLVPLHPMIQKLEYPLIWVAVIAICFVAVALGWLLNGFVRRAKNRRIDRIIRLLQSPDTTR